MFRRYKEGKKIFIWLLTAVFLLTQVLLASPVFADSSGTGRIAGDDRYKTAVAVSQKGWKTAEYAVLARGDNYADALCAGPLAIKYNGPILLTEPQKLNSDTLNELKRLGVKHVIIAGGLGAVSQSVEDALKAGGLTDIERVYGDNRYQTSVKIAEKLGSSSKVVLATGNDFPDALSISVIASKLAMPILLTGKDSLPGDISNYFQGKSITQTYIIGGTGVISSNVEKLVPGPYRLSGNDRYETNVAVLKYFESSFNFDNIYVAIGGGPKGNEFADALTGAVLAAKGSAPLILANKALPSQTADYLKTKVKLATIVTGLGGAQAVPGAILTSILAYKEQIAVAQKYDKAGTYGPETGKATITGSVTISAPDVTLRNTIIEGDLLLAQSIGDGNVYLRDVTVKGKTIVNGGGPDSVIMYNFNGQTVIVDVPDGSSVRLVAQGSTSIADVSIEGSGTLQEENLTGTGFVNVVIPAGAEVVLNGSFTQVEVEAGDANVTVATGSSITTMTIAESAAGADINLSSGTTVSTLNANAASNITGQGQITTANITTPGVSIAQPPATVNLPSGMTAYIDGQVKTGTGTPPAGGGGGGLSTMTVSEVTAKNATTVEVTMTELSGAAFTWNGSAVTGTYAGGKYTLTVPRITATTNTLVVQASGYYSKTVDYSVRVGVYENLIVIEDIEDLNAAIAAQSEGQTWILKNTEYNIPRTHVVGTEGGDGDIGTYLNISVNNLTIIGEGTPTLTTNEVGTGNWQDQQLIVIKSNNVKIEGFNLIGNISEYTGQSGFVSVVNKIVEVFGDNFTLKNCTVSARTNYNGGTIYYSTGTGKTSTIENVTLEKGRISLSGATGLSLSLKDVEINYNGNSSESIGYLPFYKLNNAAAVTVQNVVAKISSASSGFLQETLDNLPVGTTLELEAGDYDINAGLAITKDITINGAGAGQTTLVADTAPVARDSVTTYHGKNPIVWINDANVTIKNITVKATNMLNYTLVDGITASGESIVTLEDITVTDIMNSGGYNGCQHGRGYTGHIGTQTTIKDSNFSNFNKNGVHFYGEGTTGNVDGCSFTGAGQTDGSAAQNGIVFHDGAKGVVENSSFESIWYSGSGATATGVLSYGTGSEVTVKNNTFTSTQTPINTDADGQVIEESGNTVILSYDEAKECGVLSDHRDVGLQVVRLANNRQAGDFEFAGTAGGGIGYTIGDMIGLKWEIMDYNGEVLATNTATDKVFAEFPTRVGVSTTFSVPVIDDAYWVKTVSETWRGGSPGSVRLNLTFDGTTYIITKTLGGFDSYEYDEDKDNAVVLTTDGSHQTHTIYPVDEEDWVTFEAVAGNSYLIRTSVEDYFDTWIYLYDSDENSLGDNDDYDGNVDYSSGLSFTALETGSYYVQTTSYDREESGEYDILITDITEAVEKIENVTRNEDVTQNDDALNITLVDLLNAGVSPNALNQDNLSLYQEAISLAEDAALDSVEEIQAMVDGFNGFNRMLNVQPPKVKGNLN